MAGDVWLSADEHWLANDSMYNLVLDFLIDSVSEPATLATLEEIRDANLGLVNLADFTPEARRLILTLLRDRVVLDAPAQLRPDLTDASRQEYVAALQELADMAGAASGKQAP